MAKTKKVVPFSPAVSQHSTPASLEQQNAAAALGGIKQAQALLSESEGTLRAHLVDAERALAAEKKAHAETTSTASAALLEAQQLSEEALEKLEREKNADLDKLRDAVASRDEKIESMRADLKSKQEKLDKILGHLT